MLKDRTEIVFDAPIGPAGYYEEDDESRPIYEYYRSDKILGQLYRAIDEKKIWRENIKMGRPVDHENKSVWAEFLERIDRDVDKKIGVINWEEAIPEAQDIRNMYGLQPRASPTRFFVKSYYIPY